jgi:hypothetical protein
MVPLNWVFHLNYSIASNLRLDEIISSLMHCIQCPLVAVARKRHQLLYNIQK